jgi:hypothetical protein
MEDICQFGSETVGIAGVVWSGENVLALIDEPVRDFSFAALRKKRQAQRSERIGRIESVAKNASKNLLFLDLGVRSL